MALTSQPPFVVLDTNSEKGGKGILTSPRETHFHSLLCRSGHPLNPIFCRRGVFHICTPSSVDLFGWRLLFSAFTPCGIIPCVMRRRDTYVLSVARALWSLGLCTSVGVCILPRSRAALSMSLCCVGAWELVGGHFGDAVVRPWLRVIGYHY